MGELEKCLQHEHHLSSLTEVLALNQLVSLLFAAVRDSILCATVRGEDMGFTQEAPGTVRIVQRHFERYRAS